jgi:pimeloyl-ACP methyl ester carboxylesterase
MQLTIVKCVGIAVLVLSPSPNALETRSVEIPIGNTGEVQVAEIVSRLAKASGVAFEVPPAGLTLSTQGFAGPLTRTLLSEVLGPEVTISFRPGVMVITIDERILAVGRRTEWLGRLRNLGDRATEAAQRRQSYGIHALASFRPNDPSRPTVCLIHGLNSSSGGFVHVIPLLEEAGYGIVVYDYPYNRKLGESCPIFARDWAALRRQTQDRLPWSIVGHSMGALLARALVEDDASWAGDVMSLIMIAPVNQGSQLAKVQTIMQVSKGLKAINGKDATKAMLSLSDGLGQAAEDMLPGSAFLKALNRRPRRAGVAYHILAGDRGFLTREGREQIEGRLELLTQNAGIFGRLTKAAIADLPDLLDELTDGKGDGCIAVERTRLEGVSDHVVIHANHVELVRGPLLYPDPGPVACMPVVLEWLRAAKGKGTGAKP